MTSSLLGTRILERAALAGVLLRAEQLQQLEAYYELLSRWNRRINLTALPLTGYSGAAIDRLIIEPLIAAAEVAETAINWVDFGSGGGSPAIPLKIVRPQTRLTMVESKGRKAAFLREASTALVLSGTTVLTSRVEDLAVSHVAGTVELITVRAVRFGSAILDSVTALLTLDGRLLAFRGNNSSAFEDSRLEQIADRALLPSSGRLSVFVPRGTVII